MNKNFSQLELNVISKLLGRQFNVRFNKCGNITVEYLQELQNPRHGFWTLYKVNENYLWRRHNGLGDCYPLNMKNRKRTSPIQKRVSCGQTYYFYSRSYDIRNCEFKSLAKATKYFIDYLINYRHIAV